MKMFTICYVFVVLAYKNTASTLIVGDVESRTESSTSDSDGGAETTHKDCINIRATSFSAVENCEPIITTEQLERSLE